MSLKKAKLKSKSLLSRLTEVSLPIVGGGLSFKPGEAEGPIMTLRRAAAIAAMAATSCATSTSASAQNSDDPARKFMPVELQCPPGKTGNLTLVLRNRSGESVRIRNTFIDGVPEDSYYDYAPKGESYRTSGRFTPRGGGNEYGQHAALMGNTVFEEVCEGSAEKRERYMSMLSANSESIRDRSQRTPLR